MNRLLLTAAAGTFALGLVHSIVGEWAILRHLPRVRGFPPLCHHAELPKWTLRITWHILTIAGWTIAAVLAHLSERPTLTESDAWILKAIAACMFAAFAVSFVGARGRHPSWVAFLVIGVLCVTSMSSAVVRQIRTSTSH